MSILDDEETEEEASEVNRIEKEKHHYDKFIFQFKPQEGDGQPESNQLRRGKLMEKQFHENYIKIDDLLNDLHIDILAWLYRWEIKNSAKNIIYNIETIKMLKIKGLKAQNEALTCLSTTYINKFTMKNTKSIAKATNDLKNYKILFRKLENFVRFN